MRLYFDFGVGNDGFLFILFPLVLIRWCVPGLILFCLGLAIMGFNTLILDHAVYINGFCISPSFWLFGWRQQVWASSSFLGFMVGKHQVEVLYISMRRISMSDICLITKFAVDGCPHLKPHNLT